MAMTRAEALRQAMRQHCASLLADEDPRVIQDVLIAACGIAAEALAVVAEWAPEQRTRCAAHALSIPLSAVMLADDTDVPVLLAQTEKSARNLVRLSRGEDAMES